MSFKIDDESKSSLIGTHWTSSGERKREIDNMPTCSILNTIVPDLMAEVRRA